MAEVTFKKISKAKAMDITQLFELDEQGQSLLTEELSPADYLNSLIEGEDYPDAVRLIAYGLPNREATWWACLCARSNLNEKTKPEEIKAIELAEAWVYKPTPENCKVNYPAAEAMNFKSPGAWAALAAFWSGDNISPNDDAKVPPSPDLTAKAVSGAVMLAAVQEGGVKIKEKYQLFLRQGIDIACGGDGRKVQ